MTTSDNNWYNNWQRIAASGKTRDKAWQQITNIGNKLERIKTFISTNDPVLEEYDNIWFKTKRWIQKPTTTVCSNDFILKFKDNLLFCYHPLMTHFKQL